MPPAEAERVAEWAARIVLSYAISPSDRTDPCDPVAGHAGWSPPSCSRGSTRCTPPPPAPIDITPYGGSRPAPDGPVPSP